MSTTIVTAAGGLRFDAEVRDHTVRTDQPIAAGGTDTAAMPLELLDAALGTCVALYAHQFLASRGLPTNGLRVEVHSERAPGSPKRIGRFDVRVELPDGVPHALLPLIERVVQSCPVHNTLSSEPVIEFEVLTPEGVATT
jgi:putative redox protein